MAHDTELNVYQHTASQIMKKMRQYDKDMKERLAILQLLHGGAAQEQTGEPAKTTPSSSTSPATQSTSPSSPPSSTPFASTLSKGVKAVLPEPTDNDVHSLPTSLVSKLSKITGKRAAQKRYKERGEQLRAEQARQNKEEEEEENPEDKTQKQ